MIWQDILIERAVTEDEITVALANAFELPAESVRPIHTIEPGDAVSAEIVFEQWDTVGDFAIHLHVSLRTDASISLTKRLGDIELVGRIARSLNSACFIGDDDINPFTGLIVRAPDDAQPARLDPEAEDAGIYRLAPVAAHVG